MPWCKVITKKIILLCKKTANVRKFSTAVFTAITATDVSGEDASVQAIANAVFDATCLEAYRLNEVGVRSETT